MTEAAVAIGGRDVLAVENKHAGVNYASLIAHICERIGVDHLLGYGYGTSWLFRHLKVKHPMRLQKFEPGEDTPAIPAQLVACLDVLGYDDEEKIIPDLERLTDAVLFVNIHTSPERPIQWWLPKLWDRFDLHNVQVTAEDEFFVICYAKQRALKPDEPPGVIVRV